MQRPRTPRLSILVIATFVLLLVAITAARWVAGDSQPPNRRLAIETAAEQPAEHEPEHTNHLAGSTSPYLQMHAHNPVNWYPWDEEAFEKAEKQDKPIFLSVGYSTCYWCQVMERESFVDKEVASILNEHYVAIKVDREQRPDVDEQYMLATQLITGRGGWPNSVWLTPDGKPWMAGTYIPKPRFIEALQRLHQTWETQRDRVRQQADRLAEAIQRVGAQAAAVGDAPLEPALLERAIEGYRESFDAEDGGFGSASSGPKFPPHGALRLLATQHERTGDDDLIEMLTATLDAMWLGGMHDHLGGGFHRYSTDPQWLLPHFEKMLYDNAQLMRNFAEGYALTGRDRYRRAVEDIHRWLQRKMIGEGGAFYSAINSEIDGHEGATYVWHYDEIIDTLGEEDGRLFAEIYNVRENGNYREEATGEKPGTNVLHLDRPIAEIARERGAEPEAFRRKLAEMRRELLSVRNTWAQPEIDTKVLAAWNGLMIEALAYAGRTLDEPRYTRTASEAAEFVLTHLGREKDGRLMRSYRDGQVSELGYLDDHAYLAAGLVELHRATGEQRWLREAKQLADTMLAAFEDEEAGGFFYTRPAHEELLMRSKHLAGGGNVPTANGVAADVMLALGRLAGDRRYTRAAERTLKSLAGVMQQSPQSTESLLVAAGEYFQTRHASAQGPDAPRAGGTRDDPPVAAGDFDPEADAAGDADTVTNESKDLGEPVVVQDGLPVSVRVFASPRRVEPGDELTVRVALDIAEGWHLYGPNPEIDFLVPSTVSVTAADEAIGIGKVATPEPHAMQDPFFDRELNTYSGTIHYTVPVKVADDAQLGERKLVIETRTQACDDSRCLPPNTRQFELPLTVAAGG